METSKKLEDPIPSWINGQFFKETLSEHLKRDIYISNFNAKPALPKGENYLSILYRVDIEYKTNKTAGDTERCFLMIKSLPEGEYMQNYLAEIRGFEKEAYMYKTILPTMHHIIKSSKGEINPLSARHIQCPKENVIVMEDLKYLGYKMAMRKQGLDLDHCTMAVKTLARFHAASMALYKCDPKFKDVYTEGVYRDDQRSKKRFEDKVNTLASAVETWPNFEKYGEKLRGIAMTGWSKMIEIVKPKKNLMNVLNHGDCWTNNMLFRYNDETCNVEDMRFVDFQIARYTSPAIDLQYFMCNCPNDEVRFQHRDTLLQEYYSELADYCKATNTQSELISFQQLKEEFEEKNFFGLITACTVLCNILAEEEDVPDTKTVTEDTVQKTSNAFLSDIISRKRYRYILQKLLVFYQNEGLL